jgi:hypothetical protein
MQLARFAKTALLTSAIGAFWGPSCSRRASHVIVRSGKPLDYEFVASFETDETLNRKVCALLREHKVEPIVESGKGVYSVAVPSRDAWRAKGILKKSPYADKLEF